MDRISFDTHPDRYHHFRLRIEGAVAHLVWDVSEEHPLVEGYKLKLNSYDLGVDIELADAALRLRFEHPQVRVVCLSSAKDGVFSAGANIFMLGLASHSHKVNFCKFTNETRNNIEEASRLSGQTWVAAITGIASGGGYELPLACDEIHLVDDRRSTVSLPEVPYLGVLPGTGGLTRLIDKRRVRRDRADVFCTTAEGVKGQKAVDWRLVDAVHPKSTFWDKVQARLTQLAERQGAAVPAGQGVSLTPIEAEVSTQAQTTIHRYKHVTLTVQGDLRRAALGITGPAAADATLPADPTAQGADTYVLRVWRELNDALLQLRFNHADVGVVTIQCQGDLRHVLALDRALEQRQDHWFCREIRLLQGRVLKMFDVTARSFFALIEPGSCFGGSFLEIALAAYRIYMLADDAGSNRLAAGHANSSGFPMGNGLTRLQNRFYGDPEAVARVLNHAGQLLSAPEAVALGLVTEAPDAMDYDDLIRLAVEERAALSPDALTGMEANLRFVGPETMETRIFGRLSAWQNWIFTRPNATGDSGALTSYGKTTKPEFKWTRT